MTERLDVTANGVRLACHLSGPTAGPPMLLLHALGEQASDWDTVRAAFDSSYRVIAIDLRGHGDSEHPGEYSFELMRDDVLGVIDRLGLSEITLVGHSMGGAVALLVAEERPALVRRLVVEDATPPYPRERPLPSRPDGPLSFDWATVLAVNAAFRDPDPAEWERLATITAPTLLVAGGPTSHVPQEKVAEVADRIPTCTLVTIPVGHLVHVAAPAEFLGAVRDFLRRGPLRWDADGSR